MRENHALPFRSAAFSNFEPPFTSMLSSPPFSLSPMALWDGGVEETVLWPQEWIPSLPPPPTPSPRHFPNCKNSPLAHPLSPYGFLGWGCGGNRSLATKNGFPHFRLPLPSPASVSHLSSSSSASPFCVFCACVVYCNRGGEKDANCTCYRRLPGNRRSHRA